jgi:hypothetical protein
LDGRWANAIYPAHDDQCRRFAVPAAITALPFQELNIERLHWRMELVVPFASEVRARVFPLLMESEARLYDFDLTRFLHANRIHFARKRSRGCREV